MSAMMTDAERLKAIRAIAVAQAERIEVLERALRDCISTYSSESATVIVTPERQEAWVEALIGNG